MARIILIERGSPRQLQRELGRILKDAYYYAADHWERKLLPKHFTSAGASEYQYKPRTKRYMIIKAKKHHHQNPLEYSGESKRMIRRMPRITATSKGASVRLNVPWYFERVRGQKKTKNFDKVRELMAVSPGDEKYLDKQVETSALYDMNHSAHLNSTRVLTGGLGVL